MPLFDDYLICDWSAANSPKTGKDSIWIATAHRKEDGISAADPINIRTRTEAMRRIKAACLDAVAQGRRLFAGFDFAFGYPAGAARLITGKADWKALWRALAELVRDGDDNRSNRFELAAFLNTRCFTGGPGPFWGHPPGQSHDGLGAKHPRAMPPGIDEHRQAERAAKGAQSIWKLAYAGAVGSQTLLGIARLQTLRRDRSLRQHIAVWPFETRFADKLEKPVTIAEIYPSAFPVKMREGEVKDAAQVRTLAATFARLDMQDRFGGLLGRPQGLDDAGYRRVIAEEGWIVGAGRTGQSA